jgi:hypothetical protein
MVNTYINGWGTEMQIINLRLTGTTPLLLHNASELVNPFSAVNRAKKPITAKKANKTEDDMRQLARLEWEASWYKGINGDLVMPANNVYACLVATARITRQGKLIERGVNPTAIEWSLDFKGKSTNMDELWGQGLDGSPFVDYRPVGQQAVKVMRCRPVIAAGWTLDTSWVVDESMTEPDWFVENATFAGRFEGLGDFRKMYGKFDAEVI